MTYQDIKTLQHLSKELSTSDSEDEFTSTSMTNTDIKQFNKDDIDQLNSNLFDTLLDQTYLQDGSLKSDIVDNIINPTIVAYKPTTVPRKDINNDDTTTNQRPKSTTVKHQHSRQSYKRHSSRSKSRSDVSNQLYHQQNDRRKRHSSPGAEPSKSHKTQSNISIRYPTRPRHTSHTPPPRRTTTLKSVVRPTPTFTCPKMPPHTKPTDYSIKKGMSTTSVLTSPTEYNPDTPSYENTPLPLPIPTSTTTPDPLVIAEALRRLDADKLRSQKRRQAKRTRDAQYARDYQLMLHAGFDPMAQFLAWKNSNAPSFPINSTAETQEVRKFKPQHQDMTYWAINQNYDALSLHTNTNYNNQRQIIQTTAELSCEITDLRNNINHKESTIASQHLS